MLRAVMRKKRASWYWRMISSNGKIISHSETYANKFSCQRTLKSLYNQTKGAIKTYIEVDGKEVPLR